MKNVCNLNKFDLCCSIQQVDIELRRSQIVKDLKKNPNVEGSPKIFKEYLGIDNLSTEQKAALHLNRKVLLIIGPAGLGKTILLLGKIIEVAKTEGAFRSLLIVSSKRQISQYEKYSKRHKLELVHTHCQQIILILYSKS